MLKMNANNNTNNKKKHKQPFTLLNFIAQFFKLTFLIIIVAVLVSLQLCRAENESLNSSRNSNARRFIGNKETNNSTQVNQRKSILQQQQQQQLTQCLDALLTFELTTGFIYKPKTVNETLAMIPSTLQLTDCLDSCKQNNSCLSVNFEMGLCVLLTTSAKENPSNLQVSQFPVFTIYAEKKCLFSANPSMQNKLSLQCKKRAWTFERVLNFASKRSIRKKLTVADKNACMEACLMESSFECRSANWFKQTRQCALSEQDRHSTWKEFGKQQQQDFQRRRRRRRSEEVKEFVTSNNNNINNIINNENNEFINTQLTTPFNLQASNQQTTTSQAVIAAIANSLLADFKATTIDSASSPATASTSASSTSLVVNQKQSEIESNVVNSIVNDLTTNNRIVRDESALVNKNSSSSIVVNQVEIEVEYLENNCVFESEKLCEFKKLTNQLLKTVDSIHQDVANIEECKQKCLHSPYRCHSFDYGDTLDKVCRTSHLSQAALETVNEPYLEVFGATTYELATCFNVSVRCGANEMIASVKSNKLFKGKLYSKTRPFSCATIVSNASTKFELSMKYYDKACDVKALSSTKNNSIIKNGIFSTEIVIQHHNKILTRQDLLLNLTCEYDLSNKYVRNTAELLIENLQQQQVNRKQQATNKTDTAAAAASPGGATSSVYNDANQQLLAASNAVGNELLANKLDSATAFNNAEFNELGVNLPLTMTSLATKVVSTPNVTMRIANINGLPVKSATVGDRLALLFEVDDKSTPFKFYVREIIATDGKHLVTSATLANKQTSPDAATATTTNALSSVLLVDENGCPTDSNIMSSPMRLDSLGHTILAPFDAFKFPTSDMVFFGAVVTSCIDNCKDTMCTSLPWTRNSQSASLTQNNIGAQQQANKVAVDSNDNKSIIKQKQQINSINSSNDVVNSSSKRQSISQKQNEQQHQQTNSANTNRKNKVQSNKKAFQTSATTNAPLQDTNNYYDINNSNNNNFADNYLKVLQALQNTKVNVKRTNISKQFERQARHLSNYNLTYINNNDNNNNDTDANLNYLIDINNNNINSIKLSKVQNESEKTIIARFLYLLNKSHRKAKKFDTKNDGSLIIQAIRIVDKKTKSTIEGNQSNDSGAESYNYIDKTKASRVRQSKSSIDNEFESHNVAKTKFIFLSIIFVSFAAAIAQIIFMYIFCTNHRYKRSKRLNQISL